MWSTGLSAREIFDGLERREVGERLAESSLNMAADWNGNQWDPPATEQPGIYAWGEAHLLLAYVIQYEATHDVRYLETLARRIRAVLLLRDALHGIIDQVRGRVMPSWGSLFFSRNTPFEGQRTCWLVHAGMLLYPMTRFARLVAASEKLRLQFGGLAVEVVESAGEILRAYEPDWHERQSGAQTEGWYSEPILGHERPMPMNQMNALGRVMLDMAAIDGGGIWRERAASLAGFLKNRIGHQPGGSAVWAYRPGLDADKTAWGGKGEDFSHAAVNGDFALKCWQHGVVFNRADIESICKTITSVAHKGNGNFADFIDGSGDSGAYNLAIAWWGEFAMVDKEIARLIELQYRQRRPSPGGAAGMLAAAMAAKYGGTQAGAGNAGGEV